MKNNDSYERVGRLLTKARIDVDLTQSEVAKRMHISTRTIQNWEAGYSSPSLPNILDFFDAIGANPISYLEAYLYPSILEINKNQITDSQIKKVLENTINGLSKDETLELLYILRGNHGSSAYAVLQEMTANLHTTISSRHIVAEIIRFNYEREEARNELICQDDIKPDMEAFISAIEKGNDAAKNKKYGYTKNG